jgi:spermidine synthase
VETVGGDARTALETLDGPFDLVITDVYNGARMPTSVASVEFVRHVARVLDPAGGYVVNVADLPPSINSRIQAATLRAVFPDVCAITEPGLIRGRHYGNVVLAAARSLPPDHIARLTRVAARDEVRARVLAGPDLDAFIGGIGPMRDAPAATCQDPDGG